MPRPRRPKRDALPGELPLLFLGAAWELRRPMFADLAEAPLTRFAPAFEATAAEYHKGDMAALLKVEFCANYSGLPEVENLRNAVEQWLQRWRLSGVFWPIAFDVLEQWALKLTRPPVAAKPHRAGWHPDMGELFLCFPHTVGVTTVVLEAWRPDLGLESPDAYLSRQLKMLRKHCADQQRAFNARGGEGYDLRAVAWAVRCTIPTAVDAAPESPEAVANDAGVSPTLVRSEVKPILRQLGLSLRPPGRPRKPQKTTA